MDHHLAQLNIAHGRAPLADPASVLWWVPVGHRPTPEEARTRLRWLAENGPTARAFTFAEPAPPPTADDLTAVSARP
jgi:hypothetical protein